MKELVNVMGEQVLGEIISRVKKSNTEGKLLFEFANNIVLGTSISGNTTIRMFGVGRLIILNYVLIKNNFSRGYCYLALNY